MDPLFTPDQLAEIRAYRAPLYLWAALAPLVDVGISLLVLRYAIRPLWSLAGRAAAQTSRWLDWMRTAPVSRVLVQVLGRLWGGPGYGQAVWFAMLQFALSWTLTFPMAFHFGWVHERAYGFTTEPASAWLFRVFKGSLVSGIALALLAFGLFALARRTRHWWLLLGVGAGLALLGSAVFDPYRGQLYFEQHPLPAGPLRERVTGVLREAQVPFRELWVQKTSAASTRIQAYFAGQGPTRSIVLNDVLLDRFSESEVVATIAHEAGHVHESKWPARIAGSLALLLLLFGADRLLRHSARRGWFGAHEFGDLRNLPLLLFAFSLVAMTAAPVGKAFSRQRELEADRFAVSLTGDPDSFRGMLVKAARINRMDPEPPRWVVVLGFSHPPITERLEALAAAPLGPPSPAPPAVGDALGGPR